MRPKSDGSHDDLDEDAVSPKTVEWMKDRLRPMMEQLVEEEGPDALLAWALESAESMESLLREKDPDSPLLQLLDDHRRQQQGFA